MDQPHQIANKRLGVTRPLRREWPTTTYEHLAQSNRDQSRCGKTYAQSNWERTWNRSLMMSQLESTYAFLPAPSGQCVLHISLCEEFIISSSREFSDNFFLSFDRHTGTIN